MLTLFVIVLCALLGGAAWFANKIVKTANDRNPQW